MLDAAVLLGTLLVVGLPLAVWLHRDARPDVVVLAFEAAALGLVGVVLASVVAVRMDRFELSVVALLCLPVVLIGVVLCGRDRARVRVPTASLGHLLLGVPVAVGALWLRAEPSNFVFQVGDMGEYVNSANIAADGGVLERGFPHGFTVFLGFTHLLFGPAGTVAGLPALGVLLLAGLAAVGISLRLHPAAIGGVVVLAAVHPHSVWFSLFPVSEALYAVLLVLLLSLLLRAVRTGSRACAGLAGVVPGVLLLVRANALLLSGVLLAVLVAAAVLGTGREYRAARWCAGIGLAALSAAYAYNLRFPRPYFVGNQLEGILPQQVFDRAESLELLELSWALLGTVVVGLAVVLLGTTALRRTGILARSRPVARPATLLAVVVVTIVLTASLGVDGLVDAGARWGAVTLVLATVGLVLVVADRGPAVAFPVAVFLLGVVGTFVVLFAHRIPEARPAVFFLYWDRYLFSEVFPFVLVLAAIGAHALVVAVDTAPAGRRRAGAALLILLVGAALVETVPTTREATEARLLGDAFEALEAIDALTAPDERAPIAFSGVVPAPEGWFFPNTFRAFGLPLRQTFHRDVRHLPTAFRPDPQPTPSEVVEQLSETDAARGYLVVVDDCPPHCDGPPVRYATAAGFRPVGHVDYVAHVLPRELDRDRERFRSVAVRIDVLEVDLPAARAARSGFDARARRVAGQVDATGTRTTW